MYLTKTVLLLVVILQIAVLYTAADDTCTYTKTITKTFTPTKTSLDVLSASTLYNNFNVEWVESYSSDVEVAVQVCSSNKDEFDAFDLSLTEGDSGVKVTLDKVVATPAPTTAPSATPTAKPTTAPEKTVPANAGSSLKPTNFLYVLLAISALVMPKNRLSFGIVVVCAVLLFSGSTIADGTANTKLTLRIGVPPSITKFCAGSNCLDRSINGPIKTYVNILGKRYANLAQDAKCDTTASLTVPTGWKIISSDNEADMLAIQYGQWNTYLVVDTNGAGWVAGQYKSKGQDNTLARNNDGSVRLTYCEAIVLITQDFPMYETGKTIVGEPRITAASTITFHGYDYAAADNTPFSDATSNACQTYAVYLQNGWEVAPDEDASHIVRHNTIGIQSFGTKCMALANGVSYTQDLNICSTNALASTPYNGNKIVFVSSMTCNANYTRILIRRASTAANSWTTPVAIDADNTHNFNGTKFAMIDNADPDADYSTGNAKCQTHFMSVPSGYRIATGAELTGFINVEAWKVWGYFCFAANGATTDHNKQECSSLITKTVGGVNYYQTRTCGHVVVVQDIGKQSDFVIGMKILLLSTYATVAQNNDSALDLAFTMLNATGAAYDHINLIDSSYGRVFADKLDFLMDSNGNPKYYAIVVTDSQFSYKTASGSSESALTVDQKAQLSTYKYMYGVRLVSLSGYPSDPALGLNIASSSAAPFETHFRLDSDFVSANAPLLKGLKTDRSWNVTGMFCLFVTPTSNIVPIVRYTSTEDEMPTATSKVGAAIVKLVSDGTEEMHFFVANSATTIHGPLLSNMWLEWVTKGIWIGSRRVYLIPQIDDLFMDTEQFDDPSFAARVTGDDLRKTKAFLTDKNALPLPTEDSYVTLEFGYNAGMVVVTSDGTNTPNDELYDTVRDMRMDFHWESHTYTHLDLTYPESDPANGPTTESDTDFQLQMNIDFTIDHLWAEYGQLDMPNFSKTCMITPKITGLFNPAALKSMVNHKITCAVGDNSRPELIPENKYHPIITTTEVHGYPGVWIIPRSATEIYFDSAYPHAEVTQFNYRYGENGVIQKGRNFTLHEIIDQEATRTTTALMFFRHDPYMFHQCNVMHFNFTYYKDTVEKEWSLVTLWIRAVVDLYNEYMTLPIKNIKHDDLLVQYKNRLDRDQCGIDGQFKVAGGKITAATLTTTGTCEVGITGPASCPSTGACRTEQYGPDSTTWVTMNANSATMDASVQWA